MMPILPGAEAALTRNGAVVAAFAVSLGGALLAERRGRAGVAAAGALGLLAGWGVLVAAAAGRLAWVSHQGVAMLLAPACVSLLGAAALAWRGGRNRRLLLWTEAGFAGWWVAQGGVGTADFYRFVLGTLALALLLGRAMAGEASRGLAAAVTLWGGWWVAGTGPGWLEAAAVAAACGAGLAAAGPRAGAALPAAPLAALLVAGDLAGGRLLRLHWGAIDIACAAALMAPLVSGVVAARLSRRKNRFLPLLAAALTAASLTAAVWLWRRAIFR